LPLQFPGRLHRGFRVMICRSPSRLSAVLLLMMLVYTNLRRHDRGYCEHLTRDGIWHARMP
jgi:hypothetical protein